MSFEVIEAVDSHSEGSGAQPIMEWVTPEERLLLRFYRQLDEAEQAFMRRSIEALSFKKRQS